MRSVLLVLLVACLLLPAGAHAAVGFDTTTLTAEPAGTIADLTWGDVDGRDGPDLVASIDGGGADTGAVSVRLNDGQGGFGAPIVSAAPCRVREVHLGDLTTSGTDLAADGKLDAAVYCLRSGGDSKSLGRMAGDGAGHFGPLQANPNLSPGGLWNNNATQNFTLAQLRDSAYPPVPVSGWTSNILTSQGAEYFTTMCLSYDWVSRDCFSPETSQNPDGWPQIGPTIVSGELAVDGSAGGGYEEIVTAGGSQGLLAWGITTAGALPPGSPDLPGWNVSDRPFGAAPADTDVRQVQVTDLTGDGRKDILTSAGTTGAAPGATPSGRLAVLPNSAAGVAYSPTTSTVPDGVTAIGTGDFDQDGKPDLAGMRFLYVAATSKESEDFFLAPGDGAGGVGPAQTIGLETGNLYFSRQVVQVLDVDRNGTPDAVTLTNGTLRVLRNQTPPAAGAAPVPILAPGNTPRLSPPPAAGPARRPSPLTGISYASGGGGYSGGSGRYVVGTARNPPTAQVALTLFIPRNRLRRGPPVAKGAAAKPRTIAVKRTVKVPKGKRRKLVLTIPKRVRKRIGRKGVKVKLRVVATAADGTRGTRTRSVRLKPKR